MKFKILLFFICTLLTTNTYQASYKTDVEICSYESLNMEEQEEREKITTEQKKDLDKIHHLNRSEQLSIELFPFDDYNNRISPNLSNLSFNNSSMGNNPTPNDEPQTPLKNSHELEIENRPTTPGANSECHAILAAAYHRNNKYLRFPK